MDPVSLVVGCLIGSSGTLFGFSIYVVFSRRKQAMRHREKNLRAMEEGRAPRIKYTRSELRPRPQVTPLPPPGPPPTRKLPVPPPLPPLPPPQQPVPLPPQPQSTTSLVSPLSINIPKPWLRKVSSIESTSTSSWKTSISRTRSKYRIPLSPSKKSTPVLPPKALYIPSLEEAVPPMLVPPKPVVQSGTGAGPPIEARFVLEPYDEEEMSFATLSTNETSDYAPSTVLSLDGESTVHSERIASQIIIEDV